MQLYWLCVLPLLVLAAWLAYDNVQGIRVAQDQQADHIARNFAAAVDQRLQSHTNALTVFAHSPHLDQPSEWPLLYREALALQSSMGMHLALLEAAPPRRMVFNTLAPYGATLPPTPRSEGFQALPAALETLKPAVGDIFTNPFTERPTIAVVLPVVRDGRAQFAVASPIDTEAFQEILHRFSLPAGWALSLCDGTGRLIARVVPPGFDQSISEGAASQFEVTPQLAKWTVKLEIPSAARRSPLLATGAALAILLLAATLAGAVGGLAGGRRLSRAVASLTHADAPADLHINEIREAQTLLDETAERQRQSEARFRRLFQDAPIGMRLADLTGKVIAQNARFDTMFGYSIQDVPTLQAWMERAYPDPVERQRVDADWGRTISLMKSGNRRTLEGEYRITDKRGQIHVVQVRGSMLADGLLSTFVDITEQRKTEDSLRLWAEAFHFAELDLVIGDAKTDTVLVANPAFARSRGYSSEEMVGMHLSQLLPQEWLAPMTSQLKQQQQQPHFRIEGEHLRKDGSRFPVLLDVTVLHDEQGAPIARLVYAIDLTERKRSEAQIQTLHASLERRVRDRTAKLSQANQELDSFAYTVSHDLRAPLRAMDGYLHLLREELGAGLSDEAQHCLGQVDAAAHRMTGLIDGILTLSRSVRHELQLCEVDLSALATRRLDELASAEPSRDITTQVEPELVVTGDPRMLEALVTNLIDNAWKYTARTPSPHIRFYAGKEQGATWFHVADNGAGFDQAHCEKLFQPFQRLHRESEFPGMGIGLATVHRIVRRHRGQIVAKGRPGQGATFSFTLETQAKTGSSAPS